MQANNIRVNADLFRIAAICISTEETRYYLNGVFVQPHPVAGVFLVTTDGHRMLVIHDKTGHADREAIIQLPKDAMKACKSGKNENRVLIVSGVDATIALNDGDSGDTPVAFAKSVEIDGTYPHWQRVLPSMREEVQTASYNQAYVADFCKIGLELAKVMDNRTAAIHMTPYGSSPALIRWSGLNFAMGVLMPMRDSDTLSVIPDFVHARPVEPIAQAAE